MSYVVAVVFALASVIFTPPLSLMAISANTYALAIDPVPSVNPVIPPAKSRAPINAPPT